MTRLSPGVSLALLMAALAAPAAVAELAPFAIAGDAAPEPLEGRIGDAARGRTIVLDRATGNCLICHRVPVPEEPFQGDVGPDLTGVGGRLSATQIRLRLIDQSRLNPETVMPPYYRTDALIRVAGAFTGKPVLDAQQIEDVVAWLASLK